MSAVALLEKLLRARIDLATAHRHTFPASAVIQPSIVPTARLLLACNGQARYEIEGSHFSFKRGDMLLVLPRTRRSWSASRGSKFTLDWVEFESPALTHSRETHFLSTAGNLKLEQACLRRLAKLCSSGSPRAALEAEGEFKALLARFLAGAHAGAHPPADAPRTPGDRAVIEASVWLGAHFAEDDALTKMQRLVELSPNHFRLLFRRHFGCSAQHYLTALRMRAARALLRESSRPVKDVAHAVGYRDPLFFSRAYRSYWGRSPVEDRVFSP